jgi:hypothetical protein
MSLLARIALSNGNHELKTSANLLIADLNRHTVEAWNNQLEMEIQSRDSRESQGELLSQSLGTRSIPWLPFVDGIVVAAEMRGVTGEAAIEAD